MYNTFVGVPKPVSTKDATEPRRAIAARACVECRRRKTKCVGTQPCTGCLACNVACVFPEARRRGRKSQKAQVNGSHVNAYEVLVKLLFPNSPIESLKGLSRAALLERAQSQADTTPGTSSSHGSSTTSPDLTSNTKPADPDLEANERLYKLQCHDATIFEWDETSPEARHAVEDDVNALSLSQNRKSSFVGISSVAAAVRALKGLLPAQSHSTEEKPILPRDALTPMTHQSAPLSSPLTPGRISSYREEQRLIDAYFAGIHVFAPIIHEPSFRSKYLTSQTSGDRSWLALLNMVLALGSVSSSAGDSDEDLQYYYVAQQCLSLESFGSGRLETLQALVLMGGQYLHFRNRPNMASAIIVACYRMACGLGLHLRTHEDPGGKISLQEEIKRRNWWTIYVLDTWGSMTLGRPSVSAGTLVDLPRNILDDHRGELPLTEPTIHSPLIHNIQLCKIINRIQDRLIANAVLNYDEIHSYDEMLLSWLQKLPPFLLSPSSSGTDLEDARLVLKWRYQNIRFLLHRPTVLDTVIRKARFDILSVEDQAIVSRCRDIAADSIFSIQTEWRPTKICCWNAVWFLFQACLIPLLALAVESADHPDYQNWCNQLQIGIALCDDMSQLSPAGQKTKAFLEQLYMAVVGGPPQCGQYPAQVEAQPQLDTLVDIFATEWNYPHGLDVFYQFHNDGLSYLDDQFLVRPYHPYT